MHNAYVPANCECETSFREWIHFVVAPRRIESFELNKQQAQATSRSGGIDRAEEGCSSKREDHLSLSLSLSSSPFFTRKPIPSSSSPPLCLSEDRSCEFYQSQSFLADDLRLIFLQIRFRFARFSRTRLFEVVCGRMEKRSPSNHFGSGLRKYF